jgi:putative FmdB family regulatory protein
MPTYDYQCGACGHKFEQLQSITAGPLKKCPKCSKLKLKRLLGTGVGLIFKGSGFYETDYRSEGYKKAAQNDKSPTPAAPAASTSETKTPEKKESKPAATETKPETKTESKPAPKKKSS